jgi:Fe2+ transport system protein FeoA
MAMTADLAEVGVVYTIVNTQDRQLQELGFLPGEFLIIKKRALFKDSAVVQAGNSVFALRSAELRSIVVA